MMNKKYNSSRTSHISVKKFFFAIVVLLLTVMESNAQLTVNPGAGSYTTLKGAFDAINAGTHTGTITIDVTADTAETVPAVLNASGSGAASYTSILITPSGGSTRTISGAIVAGSPLIDFNGADNVTIDGLNAGGNALVIANTTASTTSGTSTIRFIGGATNNIITNSSIQGSSSSATGTNGGTIFFSTDAVTANGNDNNTISNNNIGPAGSNLPTKAIAANGSITTTAIGNSGNIINNNNIFDFFGAAVASSGISLQGGNNTWTITGNRLYQSSTRTWTTGAMHRGIEINSTTATSGNQGHIITGNIVGYAANNQTGVYTLTGSAGKFQGIFYGGITGGTISNVNNNTVASVSLTGVTSNGTTSSSPFIGIQINNGLANTNNNTIGSQSITGSLVYSTTTTTATDVYGILNFSSDDWTVNNNTIGGISVTNSGASGTFLVYVIRAFTSNTKAFNASQNTIGGTIANSIQFSATGASSQLVGMFTSNALANLSANTIRNLTTNIGTGTTSSASVIGINITSTNQANSIAQNTIYNLTNTNPTAASVVTGIQFTGSAGANLVQRNLIYDLFVASNSASAEVNGIRVAGGTTLYRNNMINIGTGINNAVQVNGFNEFLGTNTIYHNSIYIGGAPTSGTANSFAFNGSQTTNVRSFRNNIFFNARSNNGATGKNYAVKVGGTGVNPTGLTINNNVYFANGSGAFFGQYAGADVASIGAWQTAVGQDLNSVEANPLYVSTTDLNLQSGSPAIDIAANLSVTNDFTGDARPGLNSLFDVGADERDGIPLTANDMQATAFISPINGGSKLLNVAFAPQASFTNNGTANQTNITVRYRIVNASSVEVYNQTFVIPSLASFATTTVTFPNATLTSTGSHTIFAKAELGSDTILGNDQITGTLNVPVPLSGTYTVGTSGNYTSLTNTGGIFDVLNTIGASSNITINIISDVTGETGTVALNEIAGGFTTLIKPFGGARLITGSTTSSLIKVNGADGVTIDGTLAAGTSCDLTIENTNTGTIIWVASTATSGALNTVVKNTNLVGNTLISAQGIIVSGSSLGAAAEVSNNNLTITNNTFKKVQNAVFAIGNAISPDQNWLINNNAAGSGIVAEKLSFRGIAVQNAQNFTISGNQIIGVVTSTTSTATASGILIGGNIFNGTVFNNTISDIKNTNTAGYGSNGIYLNSSSLTANINVNNNFIFDVASYGYTTALVGDNGYGMFVNSGAGYNIDYNTVNMNTNQTLTTGLPAAINIAVGVTIAGAVNLRNNIFSNSQTQAGERYTIYSAAPNTVFGVINNNNYSTTGTNLGFIGSNRATLANIQTGFGQNTASVNITPVFVSATNLHLVPFNNATLDNLGTPVAGITVDIDADLRSATTPDIGADEFTSVAADCSFTTTWAGSSWNNGTPVAGVKALFTGSYSGPAINACAINVNSPANVVFTTGNSTVEGAVTVQAGATLTLNNNVNLIQTTNVANSGDITVKRNTNPLMRFDYVMWSSPVDGTQTLTGFSPLTSVSPTIRFYNFDSVNNVYTSVLTPSTTEFSNASGYLIRLPFDHPTAPTTWAGSFSGVPNNGPISLGSLTTGLYYATGNPYPSTINADAFITANSLNDALYFWRKTNGATGSAYATYTLAGGTLPSPGTLASPTSGIPNGTIQVGQGFIAKATSASFVFDNTMRVANNANQTFKSSLITATTSTIERNRIWLNLANDTETIGQTMVSYMTGATNGLDAQIDGQYFNDSPTALTSIVGGQEYAIQGRVLPFTATDIVPLGFKTETAGNYSISIFDKDGLFADNAQVIYLRDNVTNTIQNLNSGAYNFTAQAGVFNGRFDVLYQNSLSTDDVEFTSNNVSIYNQNNILNINSGSETMSTVKVFDIRGRLIAQNDKINATETQINIPATNQTLIIQITSSEGIVVVKKVAN